MARTLEENVDAAIDSIEKNKDLKVTPCARSIIYKLIKAIETDRIIEPFSSDDLSDHASCQRKVISQLEPLLTFIKIKYHTNEIGAFHVFDSGPQVYAMFFIFKFGPP